MKFKKTIIGTTLALGMLATGFTTPRLAHANDANSFFTGTWSKHPNSIDLSSSIQGDILFGYNNGCNYGAFTHTALVSAGSTYSNAQWDGPTVESTDTGTSNSVLQSGKQSKFRNYDAASLTYFSKSGYGYSGSAVVNNAKTYSGPYSWLASFSSNNQWYCSKLVSRAVHDYNGYNLGFVVSGALIRPSDVWYDSALGQRSKSVSDLYDGGSVWAKASSLPTLNATKTLSTKSSEVNYKGVKVATNNFNDEAKKMVDTRLNEEKAAGKSGLQINEDNTIVLPDAKPGLIEYLFSLYHSGVSKEVIQEKWNLTNEEMARIN